MRHLLTWVIFMSSLAVVNAQTTTSYGQNAGNGGSYNSFFGHSAGQVTTSNYNTMLGYRSGNANSTGTKNVFLGSTAGYNNTTGSNNLFAGSGAGYKMKTGSRNVFLGLDAGSYNDTGNDNVAVGYLAGRANKNSRNIFVGSYSGAFSTGSQNIYVGTFSGIYSTGSSNTFLGYNTGSKTQSGNENTFIGNYAGWNSTSGSNNTFLGSYAGRAVTTGYDNVLIGRYAGYNNNSGSSNVMIGESSGMSHTNGDRNTFLGTDAGVKNQYGFYNTFVGADAGFECFGSNNTFLGNFAGQFNGNGSNNVFIGYSAGWNLTGSDQLLIGNDSASHLVYGNFKENHVAIGQIPSYEMQKEFTLYVAGNAYATGVWKPSDARLKKNKKPIDEALAMVQSMNGMTYQYKANQKTLLPKGNQVGFMAQDLQEILPEAVMQTEDGMLSVDYTVVIPVLVEAIKELSHQNEILAEKVANINQSQETKTETEDHFGPLKKSLQNIPNPGNGSTKILYESQSASDVEIILFDINGKILKTYKGLDPSGSLEIQTSEVGAGMYHYALIENGQITATSKMILK